MKRNTQHGSLETRINLSADLYKLPPAKIGRFTTGWSVFIIFQNAVLYLGGVCTPVYPSFQSSMLELTCFNFLVQAFGTPYSFWLTYSRILNSVFFSCFSRKFKKSSQTFQAYFPPSLGFEGERKSQNWIWMSNADKDSIRKIHDKK